MSESQINQEDHKDLRAALAASPQALLEYWSFLQQHYDDVQADTQAAMAGLGSQPQVQPVVAPVFQDPQIREQRLQMYRLAFAENNWGPYRDFIHAIGRQFAQRGMVFEDYSSLVYKLRRKLARRIKRVWAADARRLELALDGMDLF